MQQPILPTEVSIPRLVETLFRQESGRMTAVLTRLFGAQQLKQAEDVVQDAFGQALQTWSNSGVPANPPAWLYQVARNRALNIVKREKHKRTYAAESARAEAFEPAPELLFSEPEIRDDQLRMMFTCCHPALSPDAQVVLILKTLCGLQIPEIARAFLSTEENIHKRLVRARQKIRAEQVAFQVPEGAALRDRLAAVLDAIYLLFNEGYSASKGDALIRYDLCAEAIRLAELAAGHPVLQHEPSIAALCALMYLNAARFPAREDADGRSIPLDEQDRSLWDAALMEKGFFYLRQSRSPGQASRFHWLAAISACHCAARSYADTDWKRILNLYDGLQELDASPLVVLNRAVAVERVSGAAAALTELEKIKNDPALRSYYLFYAAQGTFYLQAAAFQEAALAFSQAIELAPREAERQFFQKKLDIARQSED